MKNYFTVFGQRHAKVKVPKMRTSNTRFRSESHSNDNESDSGRTHQRSHDQVPVSFETEMVEICNNNGTQRIFSYKLELKRKKNQ